MSIKSKALRSTGRRIIASSNKNQGAKPGDIFHTNRSRNNRHNVASMLDTAGIGKKSPRGSSGNTAQRLLNAGVNKTIEAAGAAFGGVVGKEIAGEAAKHKREVLIAILLLIIIIMLPFFFLLYLVVGNQLTIQQQQQGQTDPLQVTFVCNPSQTTVGQTSVCTLTVSYPGTANDVLATINILPGATYVSSNNGTYNATSKIVTWDAKKLNLSLKSPINLTFTATVRLTANNKEIPVTYSVGLPGSSLGGSASEGCGTFNKNATDFTTLMTGQGRCVNVLGDENSFVTKLLKVGGTKFSFNGRQAELQQIYTAATAQKVNPLILVTIWGVESSFGTVDGENFNCGSNFHDSFSDSLSCAVNTLNHYMTYFEQQKKKPVVIPPSCSYNDPFVYAYEWYTPVCHDSDGNGSSRANFVLFYKELFGS